MLILTNSWRAIRLCFAFIPPSHIQALHGLGPAVGMVKPERSGLGPSLTLLHRSRCVAILALGESCALPSTRPCKTTILFLS